MKRTCPRHGKPVKIRVLWADGRAVASFCSTPCFEAWKRTVKHPEIVKVMKL